MRTVSLKLSEQTMRQVDELQSAFAPFTENRSQTFRVAIEILHSLVFTKGTLRALVGRLQGMLRNNSYFQLEFEFPSHAAPGAAGSVAVEDGDRPRVISISRRSRLSALEMEASRITSVLAETWAERILA